jgi:hypothetical protein
MHDSQTTGTDAWPMQLLVGLAVTIALVLVAFYFFDLPLFRSVSGFGLNRYPIVKWLTRPPEVFVTLAPFVVLAGLLRRWFGPGTRPEKVALTAAVATLFAALASLLLKMAFGRSCPNLVGSPLHVGAYGFYPFRMSPDYWALPSGHTACTLSVTSVLQVAYPSGRLVWWSLAGIVPVALIAVNDHFVGDVIAGAFVGWAIGRTVVKWTSITPQPLCLTASCHFWHAQKRTGH